MPNKREAFAVKNTNIIANCPSLNTQCHKNNTTLMIHVMIVQHWETSWNGHKHANPLENRRHTSLRTNPRQPNPHTSASTTHTRTVRARPSWTWASYRIIHTMKLDLHGITHADADRLVENFVLLNQSHAPLTIVTGNSPTMTAIVQQVLDRIPVDEYDSKTYTARVVVRRV